MDYYKNSLICIRPNNKKNHLFSDCFAIPSSNINWYLFMCCSKSWSCNCSIEKNI